MSLEAAKTASQRSKRQTPASIFHRKTASQPKNHLRPSRRYKIRHLRRGSLGALKKLRAAPGFGYKAFVGVSLANMGKHVEAEKVLVSLTEEAKKGGCPDYVALAYLAFALGDRDNGFAFLNQAYESRDQGVNRLELAFTNPMFWLEDSRHDPRFTVLLKKMGSPAAYITQ